MNKNQMEFPISIYGSMEKFNDTLSKARCRIFYKGKNRNGTYITDQFAEELISTLHYVPVKGIYDGKDYTDHGQKRSEGQIYGIVPETNNFAWENHVDEDGVERTYACTDVYLFTALYPEASEAIGKGQSMELYEPSLSYHFSIYDGQRYVEFEHGSFLGLQVLGDNVEPCFEGASFFSLQQSIEDTIQKIKQYSKGGESEMKINFKLSDDQKYSAIWNLLNSEYNEENDFSCTYSVGKVFDDYALAFNLESGAYEKVYFTKNEETEEYSLGEKVPVCVYDVTESEKLTVDALRALNGDTYELVNENLTKAEENANSCAEFSTKIEELNEEVSTLKLEAENAQAKITEIESQYTEAQAQISALTEENEALKVYKKSVEDQSKEAVVAEYTDKLSEDVLNAYKAKFDEYTAEELDMHLAYEFKKANASVFTQAPSGRIPKDNPGLSGVEEFLARYKIN